MYLQLCQGANLQYTPTGQTQAPTADTEKAIKTAFNT